MSRGRTWAMVTIVVVACLIAIGLGLGLGLSKKDDDDNDVTMVTATPCPEPRSSARLSPDSPIYSPPTLSIEGVYRYGAVASDASQCSTVGTETKSKHIVMAREMAPGASTENMYKQDGWSSFEGSKSIAVPGEVKGLYEAWKLGGRLPWKVLFQPSIQMCIDGFTVGRGLKEVIESRKPFYDRYDALKRMLTNPNTGDLYSTGDLMKLPKLGATLQRVADDPLTFYNGSLADDIIDDLNEHGGIITHGDLKAYTAVVQEAPSIDLSNGNTAMTLPPPSSGGIVLLILNILQGYDLNEDSISTVEKAVETYHRIIEAFKHGFSVRTQFGDPDVENQDFKDKLKSLLTNTTSSSFGDAKRARITDRTHNTDYYEPLFTSNGADSGTRHISVLAPNGDAVSVTSTVNTGFGSKIVGSRTGIVFNNEMDDFSTPNTTNFFGIPASEANFIKPRKRPLSSMSPTIVINTTSGDVRLIVGAAGGSRIITATAFVILETLWLRLGVKEAIDFPRIHHQLIPDEIRITNRFQQVLRDGLEKRGHKFNVLSTGSTVTAVLRRQLGEIYANCDFVKYGVPDGV